MRCPSRFFRGRHRNPGTRGQTCRGSCFPCVGSRGGRRRPTRGRAGVAGRRRPGGHRPNGRRIAIRRGSRANGGRSSTRRPEVRCFWVCRFPRRWISGQQAVRRRMWQSGRPLTSERGVGVTVWRSKPRGAGSGRKIVVRRGGAVPVNRAADSRWRGRKPSAVGEWERCRGDGGERGGGQVNQSGRGRAGGG